MERETVEAYALAGIGAVQGAWKYYRPQPATMAWMALAAGIAGYEITAQPGQLMSESADRLINRRPLIGRAAILAAGLVITGHVANAIPDRVDPMHRGLKLLKGF